LESTHGQPDGQWWKCPSVLIEFLRGKEYVGSCVTRQPLEDCDGLGLISAPLRGSAFVYFSLHPEWTAESYEQLLIPCIEARAQCTALGMDLTQSHDDNDGPCLVEIVPCHGGGGNWRPLCRRAHQFHCSQVETTVVLP
jgi:hypothetical protein